MTPTNEKNPERTNSWEDKDGATDVDGFLKAFAEDDNTFWRAEQGHILNVMEELIDRLSKCKEALKKISDLEWSEGLEMKKIATEFLSPKTKRKHKCKYSLIHYRHCKDDTCSLNIWKCKCGEVLSALEGNKTALNQKEK